MNLKWGKNSELIDLKLRTDPSKDEVLTMYKVLHENHEGDLPAVE